MTASFGQLIKEQRIEKGLTQQRLADLVGRSPSTVRSWERDRATPNDETVIDSLSAVLGLDKGVLFELAGVEFAGQSPEAISSSEVVEAPTPTGLFESGSVDVTQDFTKGTDEAVGDSEDAAAARHSVQMGPEPASRPNAGDARLPGQARAPEPAKPYLLQTDRRADQVRPGPARPDAKNPDEWSLYSDDAPDPLGPPFDWDAEIDLDELPDDGPSEGLDGDLSEATAVEAPGDTVRDPETVLEVAGSETAAVFGGAADEPTQILVAAAPAEERLLGIATAKAVEFMAEPRPRPVVEPEMAEVTEVIERTALMEPAPTVEAVPQVTEPVVSAPWAGASPQQRTQTLESGRPIGPNSYLDDPKELRGYRIRAGLTAAALIAMLIVARWAWSGFREQLGGILDTLTTGF